jgi:hypothetical protein
LQNKFSINVPAKNPNAPYIGHLSSVDLLKAPAKDAPLFNAEYKPVATGAARPTIRPFFFKPKEGACSGVSPC